MLSDAIVARERIVMALPVVRKSHAGPDGPEPGGLGAARSSAGPGTVMARARPGAPSPLGGVGYACAGRPGAAERQRPQVMTSRWYGPRGRAILCDPFAASLGQFATGGLGSFRFPAPNQIRSNHDHVHLHEIREMDLVNRHQTAYRKT